ncbi:MAG: DHA2 family efflux MFS transporter permease subunit [Marinilabiliales bacterium]|nr:DHA2 family efflux MFS transporter permease subunit [Marinilabiliales bacterium]
MKRRVTPSHRIRRYIRNRDSRWHPSHDLYKWFVLANIMIGTFMAVLDATIINVALPKMMSAFGVGLDTIEWVLTAYMLALAVMLPTAAWLADHFGYKRLYFIGLLVFTLGSLLCGISGNENLLIFSRVIQGLGAGIIQPLGMAIVVREFPPKQRGVAVGFWTIAAAASVSFGPLIGGYLVDNFNWQLIFDINVPVGIFGMLTTLLIQREMKQIRGGKFDIVGFISVSLFLPIILFALTEGNAVTNSEGWKAPYILACFAISIVAFAVFITAELVVENPLIELKLLGNYNFGISTLVMFLFGIGMFGSTFLLPLYLQNSLGYTALQSGSVFLPVGIIQGIVAPMSGYISSKINPKIPIILGILLMSFSFYLNSHLSFLTEHSAVMIPLYLRGLGMGVIYSSLLAVSLIDIPRDKMAQASGINNVVRQLGGSFGVAILATFLSTRVNYHADMYGGALQSNNPSYQITARHIGESAVRSAGSSIAVAKKQAQMVIASNVSKQAYIEGINDDFLIASLVTLIGGVPIFFLRTKKKQKVIKS